MPRIAPYLYYRDVAAALDWLARAKIVEEPADPFYGDRRYGAEDPKATSGTSPSTSATSRRRT
jgi:hypothetical protein